MYLWDTNILRHFIQGNPTLQQHLQQTPWSEIALPSVVVAEVLRGRAEFALKCDPQQAPNAHQQLMKTQQLLRQFQVVVFYEQAMKAMVQLQQRVKTRKRYADVMIAAMGIAGNHVVVTRNQKHFASLLPKRQLVNWIDGN